MNGPMTDERLEEIREDFTLLDEVGGEVDDLGKWGLELIAEIDRLTSELRDIAYNTSTSIPLGAPPEAFFASQLASAIGRAARALRSKEQP